MQITELISRLKLLLSQHAVRVIHGLPGTRQQDFITHLFNFQRRGLTRRLWNPSGTRRVPERPRGNSL